MKKLHQYVTAAVRIYEEAYPEIPLDKTILSKYVAHRLYLELDYNPAKT